MRVLAIGEEWIRLGGVVHLLSSALPAGLAKRCSDLGIRLQQLKAAPGSPGDVTETGGLVNAASADLLVVDGYHLGRLPSIEIPTLAIDDFGIGGFTGAELLLDQNAGSSDQFYADSHARLLLGPKYCLLRREFLARRSEETEVRETIGRILVTLGGADPDNVTSRILDTIGDEGPADRRIDVVIGAANQHRDQIEAAAAGLRQSVSLHDNVTNMAELMTAADLAIAAPGVTCWELAYLGVPMLLATLAENQRANGEFLFSRGIAQQLDFRSFRGDLAKISASRRLRQDMRLRGMDLIDGRGLERVCRHLCARLVELRPATKADIREWWEWSNDPDVRAVSFSSDPIPWESHERWFRQRLDDPDCRLLIAGDSAGTGFAQIRFDLDGNTALISISLAPGRRGQGRGTQVIWTACDSLFRSSPIERIEALIMPDNAASIRAFEKAGFVSASETEVKQRPARRFVLERGQMK